MCLFLFFDKTIFLNGEPYKLLKFVAVSIKKFFFLLIAFPAFCQNVNINNIEIIRDHYGVPHIYSDTDKEVANIKIDKKFFLGLKSEKAKVEKP